MPTVTPPYAPASSAAAAWPAEAPSLLPLVRRALHGAEGRVALRLVPAGPRLRRAARLLLQDSARAGGGRLLETAAGELLLLGATEASAERARAGLAEAAGTAPGATLWRLPEESGPLLA
jgi:hypothetical protein